MAKKTEETTALAPRPSDLNKYLLDRSDQLAEWCNGTGLDPQSLRRIAVRESMKPDSRLIKCDPRSIFLSLCDAAQLGLEPSGLGGEGYLVPFWNKDLKCHLATFMPGWQGLVKLARRHVDVLDVWAHAVYDCDEFVEERGTDPKLIHRPGVCEDPSNPDRIIAAYAVADIRDGRPHFEVLNKADLERIRRCSQRPDSGPWRDWYSEMARKSAIRRLAKYLPKERRLAIAVAADSALEVGDYHGYRAALDIDSEPEIEALPEPPKSPGADSIKKALGVGKEQETEEPVDWLD